MGLREERGTNVRIIWILSHMKVEDNDGADIPPA